MVDVFKKTAEFANEVLGLKAPPIPVRLHPERKQWTRSALLEEVQEFTDATEIDEEIDALLDLIYFAAGRLHEMGVDGGPHFDLIHDANMQKERGELSKRPGSRGYDAVKPEGWEAPDHVPLLKAAFPKIILLGYARHGKDTVAELLRDRWGFQFDSSSMFCAEKVMMPYFDAKVTELGGPDADEVYVPIEGRTYRRYPTVEACYADRVHFRDVWYDQISAYNEDPSRLCRELFEAGNQIYVGMRSAREFKAAQKYADLVIWVDASGRGLPPEDESSCTVNEEMADFTLYNNGTLEELETAVDGLISMIEKKAD